MTKTQREKRLFQIRHCEGKRRFTSKAHARRVAEKMTEHRKTPLVHYRCEVCGFYHIGHEKTPFRMFMMAPHRREVRHGV